MAEIPLIIFDLEHTLFGLSDSYSTVIHHYSLEAMASYLAQAPESNSFSLLDLKHKFTSEIIGLNKSYFNTHEERTYENVLKEIFESFKLDTYSKDILFLFELSILAYFMEQLMNWQITPGMKDVLIDLYQHGANLVL